MRKVNNLFFYKKIQRLLILFGIASMLVIPFQKVTVAESSDKFSDIKIAQSYPYRVTFRINNSTNFTQTIQVGQNFYQVRPQGSKNFRFNSTQPYVTVYWGSSSRRSGRTNIYNRDVYYFSDAGGPGAISLLKDPNTRL